VGSGRGRQRRNAIVSDDLGLLDHQARDLLEEILRLGRAADDSARSGPPAQAVDLMEASTPRTFSGAGHRLVIDPAGGSSVLDR
jgi:hypothetical protein